MNNRAVILTLGLVLVVSALSWADWATGDGHKMHFPQLPDVDGWAVDATSPNAIADDWICSETGWVKDIHIWGAWFGGLEWTVDSFTLRIYSDIPADQSPTGFSMPGELLWQKTTGEFIVALGEPGPDRHGWYDPSVPEFFVSDAEPYFQYNFFFEEPDWFWQEEETVYWLYVSVWVEQSDVFRWGWLSTEEHWNDDAAWPIDPPSSWQEILEPPFYDYVPGDFTGDGVFDIADAVAYTAWVFQGGPPPACPAIPGVTPWFYPCADCDGDCTNTADDITCMQLALQSGTDPGYCPDYPPISEATSLDVAFVITGSPYGPEMGACCDAETFACYQATGDACVAAGDFFAGPGVPCDPDPCDTCLMQYPGDVDNDGQVNISDMVYLVNYLYQGGPAPVVLANADASGDCCVDWYDVYMIWQWFYLDFPEPLAECTCVDPPVCVTSPLANTPGQIWRSLSGYSAGDGDPTGTDWEEWCPLFASHWDIECFVDQEANGYLSAGDTLSVIDPNRRMSHRRVLEMRPVATMRNTVGGDTVYMSMHNPQVAPHNGIINPWGTLWEEAHPECGRSYQIVSWHDYAQSQLGAGQTVTMQRLDGPDSLAVLSFDVLTLDFGVLVEDVLSPSCCVLVGDVNHDGIGPDITDLVYLVAYMFGDGPPPPCMEEVWGIGGGDSIDIADLVYLVGFMFQHYAPPPSCPCPW